MSKHKSFEEQRKERLEQKRKENRAIIAAMGDVEFEILKGMVAEETENRKKDDLKRMEGT